MDNKGLLFIPDISGFTRFINETEINHSRLIIQELLEILINSNETGMEISEIEGDAVLFYKFGEKPALQYIYHQVEIMFCSFTHHLMLYDQHRYCQCRACSSAVNLTLKIITHYGEFTSYRVKDFTKLIGKDVIVAHQLLKNEIEQHEYWLVTSSLQPSSPGSLADWMKWNISTKLTESGEIPFHYTQLTELKNIISVNPVPLPDLSAGRKLFTVSKEYNSDIIALFHAAGDFGYRSQWMEGIISVEDVPHNLPRIGMKCRCITKNGESVITSTGYSFSDSTIEFTETNQSDKSIIHYLLEKSSSNKTTLTINYYINRPFSLFYNLRRNRLKSLYLRSMENLDFISQQIIIPGITGS